MPKKKFVWLSEKYVHISHERFFNPIDNFLFLHYLLLCRDVHLVYASRLRVSISLPSISFLRLGIISLSKGIVARFNCAYRRASIDEDDMSKMIHRFSSD